MFSRWRSHTVISKLRGSRPYCSWTRGSGTRMMCCKDWWSLKRRLFSAAKTCPPQEQEVPSTVKREGIHCEKQGGAAKKNSTLRVSKTTVSDTSPQKQLGASLSLGDYSQPVSCLTGASWSGPLWEAHSPGPVAFAVPEKFQEEAEGCRLVHLDWEGDTSAISCLLYTSPSPRDRG